MIIDLNKREPLYTFDEETRRKLIDFGYDWSPSHPEMFLAWRDEVSILVKEDGTYSISALLTGIENPSIAADKLARAQKRILDTFELLGEQKICQDI